MFNCSICNFDLNNPVGCGTTFANIGFRNRGFTGFLLVMAAITSGAGFSVFKYRHIIGSLYSYSYLCKKLLN